MASRLERAARKIHDELGDPSVECAIGRNELARHGQKRRIVWVHGQGRVERPRQAGGRVVGSEANGTRQTATWMRLEAVEVHIYAEDERAIDELFDRLLVAIDEAYPNPEITGYTWTTDEPGQNGLTLRQPKIVLLLMLRFPVIAEIQQLAPLQGESHECMILPESS